MFWKVFPTSKVQEMGTLERTRGINSLKKKLLASTVVLFTGANFGIFARIFFGGSSQENIPPIIKETTKNEKTKSSFGTVFLEKLLASTVFLFTGANFGIFAGSFFEGSSQVNT